MVDHACYPSTGKIEAKELPLVQGQHELHSELQANLGIRHYLNKKK